MQAYEMSEVIASAHADGKAYFEFLRAPDLSAGLYRLPAGGVDPQRPHSEDEVYYVVSGCGRVRVGDEERAVMPGSVVYVQKHAPHKFHSITEDLTLLVFFAPAEYSRASTQADGA
jgi:mannose-6-phosphate isomerase-like protein (cupin superfamily)